MKLQVFAHIEGVLQSPRGGHVKMLGTLHIFQSFFPRHAPIQRWFYKASRGFGNPLYREYFMKVQGLCTYRGAL